MNTKHAAPGSIWRITGTYRSSGTFHDCLAIVLDPAIHGTDETVFAMLPPLGWGGGMDDKVITPEQITDARLVVADPWATDREDGSHAHDCSEHDTWPCSAVNAARTNRENGSKR